MDGSSSDSNDLALLPGKWLMCQIVFAALSAFDRGELKD